MVKPSDKIRLTVTKRNFKLLRELALRDPRHDDCGEDQGRADAVQRAQAAGPSHLGQSDRFTAQTHK
jgi:hypothetical protein